MSRKGVIYLAGGCVLGFFYQSLRALPVNRLILFVGIACYLILLRVAR